jgi:hypothetical protein
MIHVLATNDKTYLFGLNEKVQATKDPQYAEFVAGEFVDRKLAQEIEPGEWVRGRGMKKAIQVVSVRKV